MSLQLADDECVYQVAETQSLSAAIVRAVARFINRDSTENDSVDQTALELEPLYETIDPEALEALFDTLPDESSAKGTVQFEYSGCEVTVKNTGSIIVAEE